MEHSFTIGGQIVDLVNSRIFSGVVVVEDGKITKIESSPSATHSTSCRAS